ncbi:hypothetical protein Nepgr_000621 [Nepenthes gracilis]|uniref:Uncharacterized protein n=1 Tax=Nepenthes gracilis TaxID=150966 RepID=A0AAD3P420_NEPGR|nr:hypothetical protein Nepgr_000621 [Nepenthes gracilis]
MENQLSPVLSWPHYHRSKSIDELRHSLMQAKMELETTRAAVQEELRRRDEHVIHLKYLLETAVTERNEAQQKCQALLLENLLLHQQKQQQQQTFDSKNGFSSSDCEESIVSSPPDDPIPLPQAKPLPEKGKLLQAVVKAGPLLQSLILAGPLPRWRYPPPPLEIPPVLIPSPPPPAPPQLLQQECMTDASGGGRWSKRKKES